MQPNLLYFIIIKAYTSFNYFLGSLTKLSQNLTEFFYFLIFWLQNKTQLRLIFSQQSCAKFITMLFGLHLKLSQILAEFFLFFL